MSNSKVKGGSTSYAKKEDQMAAYDKLPPSLRAALQNADNNWAAYPIARWFNNGKGERARAAYWVKQIARWDKEQRAKWAKAKH